MVSFSAFPLKSDAFSGLPFNIIRPEDKPAFSLLTEILLLETGPRAARTKWQKAQLANLLNHARQRSKFWRERIDAHKVTASCLQKLPILSRADANTQITQEGALLSSRDQVETLTRATSGSTGEPVKFHATSANAIFNEVRAFAQYLIEDRDLSLNRCRMFYDPRKPGYSFSEEKSFAGALSGVFQTGKNAEMHYFGVDYDKIISKLTAYKAQYVVCLPQFIEAIASVKGIQVFRQFDTKLIITYGQSLPASIAESLAQSGIPHTSSYSCEEVGLIASECRINKGFFHVAESNVIVEPGDATIDVEGHECRNVLVTGLHTYATPFIRYDVGDFAQLQSQCPCGHEGPVITRLLGRIASTLKLPHGVRRPFYLSAQLLQEIIKFDDLRSRQVSENVVTVEIVAADPDPDTLQKLKSYFQGVCGDTFQVEIKFCSKIDWGQTRKRHSFLCEI